MTRREATIVSASAGGSNEKRRKKNQRIISSILHGALSEDMDVEAIQDMSDEELDKTVEIRGDLYERQ